MTEFTMHLEIDEHSVTITDCPKCGQYRLAIFDVIALTENGAGKLTEIGRCYNCEPHAEER